MYKIILTILFFGSTTATLAESAVQTDWAGGPGVLGPVLELGNDFYSDTGVRYTYSSCLYLKKILLQEPHIHIVNNGYGSVYSVYSADVNGDGFIDILGALTIADEIRWWENTDGSGTNLTQHTVDGDFEGASSVFCADINGDGFMDILGAANKDDEITWWENIDGSGSNWNEHIVDGNFDSAASVFSADINGDSYLDILGAALFADDITWWENVDGSGTNWLEHTVDPNFDGAKSVCADDINGDGFIDVLGAAAADYDITWWENVDGSGTIWTEHTIDGLYSSGDVSVSSGDVNGDGCIDVLGAAFSSDEITWWENTDGSGLYWTEHTVDGEFDGAISVSSADINGDGLLDILGAAFYEDDIAWWQNVDGSGRNWIEHMVDVEFPNAKSVFSSDINGDGYLDVLGSGAYYERIAWWDLHEYPDSGWLESSILDTDCSPQWAGIDWNGSEPAGTDMYFQYKTSNDPGAMGTWSDPLFDPCLLSGLMDRYVQYKVVFESFNSDSTPILYDVTLCWDPVNVYDTTEPVLHRTVLLPFSPNPSSISTVRFCLSESSHVEISIFDLTGRLIGVHEDEYPSGYSSKQLDTLSPGIYFCTMRTGDFSATERVVILN